MTIGIFKMTTLTLLLTCACATMLAGCRSDQGIDGASGGVVAVPHGYMARKALSEKHTGSKLHWGILRHAVKAKSRSNNPKSPKKGYI